MEFLRVSWEFFATAHPVSKYLLKPNNGNTRSMFEMCSNLATNRNSHSQIFCKIDVLKKFASSQEYICVRVSFLVKMQAAQLY